MNATDRYNEILKAQATFFNALALGAIVAGGFEAISRGEIGGFLSFLFVGVILHAIALGRLREMRIE